MNLKFWENRTVGFWFSAASLLFALISFIAYMCYGGSGHLLDGGAIAMMVIGMAVNVVVLVRPLPLIEFISFALYFGSLGLIIIADIGFISNVFVGTDGQSFEASYLTVFIAMVIAMAACIGACVTNPAKKKKA